MKSFVFFVYLIPVVIFLASFSRPVSAQDRDSVPPANLDESKVPEYILPDPLIGEDGFVVDTPEKWTQKRRPELFRLFEEQVYGRVPLGKPETLHWKTISESDALNGKARLKNLRLFFTAKTDGDYLDILIVLPKQADAKHPVPVALGLNFKGNHTVSDEPAVPLGTVWTEKREQKRRYRIPEPATEKSRGEMKRRWPLERIVDHGFALVTAYYCQIEPDFNGGIEFGLRRNEPRPKPDEWGAIGAWGWGLSRIMDYIEQDGAEGRLDAKKVMLVGHSRLGKTALWAGARDQRFAVVVSNNSGSGGAAISRRRFGETIQLTNVVRPEWFASNFHRYNECPDDCPVDQHELIALIAPRPVYVASATQDLMADPRGEFLAAHHADPVYRLLGTDGFFGIETMPEPDRSVGGRIRYHVRTGKHDLLEYDWEQYLDFASDYFGTKTKT